MVLLTHTGNATDDFSTFYAAGGWRGNQRSASVVASSPMSGQGSKLEANGVSCGVLSAAVRLVQLRRHTNEVRIIDTPCGDFTWMPHCLDRIAAEQPSVRLRYRGVDVVPQLIRQLNAGEGAFLVGGKRTALVHADRIEIEPFMYADLARPPPQELVGHYDVALSHHVLMHTKLAGIDAHIAFWQAVARWVVIDSWPLDTPNRELPKRPPAYRTVDLHAPPFAAAPAACAEPDAGEICKAQRHRCQPHRDIWPGFIELHRLPLRRRASMQGPQYHNQTHWSPHASRDVRRCTELLRIEQGPGDSIWLPSFGTLLQT